MEGVDFLCGKKVIQEKRVRGKTKVGWIFLQLLFPFPHDVLIKWVKCIRLICLIGNIITTSTNAEFLEFVLSIF